MSRKSLYLTLCTAAALLVLTAFVSVGAWAAPAAVTFTVDTQSDLVDNDTSDGLCSPGSCSLRAAIMQANLIPGPGVTIILPSGVYTLTRPPGGSGGPDTGDLNLATPATGNPTITISGAGAASTIIDANQIDRVLSVDSKRTATISGVTIRNGFNSNTSGAAAKGGGIFNQGVLTIVDCVIEGNQATDNSGGGIYNEGTIAITRSTIRLNSAFLGGGLLTASPTVIRDSTLYANHASFGGGIMIGTFKANPSLTIVNSTISQNSADTDGGGIDSEADTFLYNTSVIDNDADHDRDELGGIGGGVYANGNARFVVVNTLIARNTLLDSPASDDCHGTLESYGFNMLSDLDGCTFSGNGESSIGVVMPDSLGPLQDNGGPTLTHALLPASPAIDNTSGQGCVDETGAKLTTDQRGKPRPGGFSCDVGAFEVQDNTAPVATPQTFDAIAGQAKPITLTASDVDGDPLTYSLVSQPAHGTLNGIAPNLNYTATTGFVGDDHFTFKVNDGKADSPSAQVIIHVTAAPVTNTPPVANPQSVSTLSGQAKQIMLTASDADADPLSYTLVSQPLSGTISGTAPNLTYTPKAGFIGSDHFRFKVNDSAADSANAEVTVHVTATPVTNTPPVANPQSVNAVSGQAKQIILTASDTDGDPLSYSLVSQPAHGVLSGTAPNLTYTATNGFTGNDHVSFKVNDGAADSPAAVVTIVVKGTGPLTEDKIYLPLTKR